MPWVQRRTVYFLLFFCLLCNFSLWSQTRTLQARWINVPPVPPEASARMSFLGDGQFAYRAISLMLQNLGDSGGAVRALREYDYEKLSGWLDLSERLDPRSRAIPYLAAYYFGGVDDPEKIAYLADYLHRVGLRTQGDSWNWMGQAIYMKRFKMNDLDTAYRWSLELAAMDRPGMPAWAKQMPAFISKAQGDKQAAYDIMVEVLKSDAKTMHPNEVHFMIDFICNRLLEPEAAKADPICQKQGP